MKLPETENVAIRIQEVKSREKRLSSNDENPLHVTPQQEEVHSTKPVFGKRNNPVWNTNPSGLNRQ